MEVCSLIKNKFLGAKVCLKSMHLFSLVALILRFRENLKHESEINTPSASHSRMFGIPLDELMGFDGEKDGLPRVVRDCIQYLRESGMQDRHFHGDGHCLTSLRQVWRKKVCSDAHRTPCFCVRFGKRTIEVWPRLRHFILLAGSR